MKRLLSRLALLSIAAVTPAQAEGPVVVELFTSQGCSSCPPADAFLHELTARDDVIALSMHVDYWDYLGWRDTFASAETTARQYAYRDATGARIVYTPQMVVHGEKIVSGNRPDEVRAAIEAAAKGESPVEIRLRDMPGMLHAELLPGQPIDPVTVWVVTYDRSQQVEIVRGENRGKTLTYENVVRNVLRIGDWDGREMLDVPLPSPAEGEGVVIFLQDGPGGPIVTAAKVEG